MRGHFPVHYIPVFTAVTSVVSILSGVYFAVSRGQLDNNVPYISRLLLREPGNIIFEQINNSSIMSFVLVVFIRYVQLESLVSPHKPPNYLIKASLVTGWCEALVFNLAVDATTAQKYFNVHFWSAVVWHFFHSSFIWIQVLCSEYEPPNKWTTQSRQVRRALTIYSTLCSMYSAVLSMISPWLERNLWNPETLFAPIQWSQFFCFSAYVATFRSDFRHLVLLQKRWK